MTTTKADYRSWIGTSRESVDIISRDKSDALAACLGVPRPMRALPACWSWLYHLDIAPRDQLGQDGHPRTGGFLPPIPAKRRMFAGSRLRFHAPVCFGEQTRLTQTVSDISVKTGRSGRLWLVTVQMDLHSGKDLLIEETRSIVYLDHFGGPRIARPFAGPRNWSVNETPDSAGLFRFSALTFNAHRIHYDRDYARSVEGYPERVIHGPLQAILLAHQAEARCPTALTGFHFRGISPAFLGETLTLTGGPTHGGTLPLASLGPDGSATTTAEASYSE